VQETVLKKPECFHLKTQFWNAVSSFHGPRLQGGSSGRLSRPSIPNLTRGIVEVSCLNSKSLMHHCVLTCFRSLWIKIWKGGQILHNNFIWSCFPSNPYANLKSRNCYLNITAQSLVSGDKLKLFFCIKRNYSSYTNWIDTLFFIFINTNSC